VSTEEWDILRQDLDRAGVAGSAELGRFVSNTDHFAASTFDERAAMPVLIAALPRLSDPKLVSAVAGHLRRSWSRPSAFDALFVAFLRWAPNDRHTGWALGDAVGTAATIAHVEQLLAQGQERRFGQARQMVVHALGRFAKAPEVAPVLLGLIKDPDVALHAMQALKRVVGPEAALPHIEEVEAEQMGTALGGVAAREARKMRKALAR
jgi:hypothetical protein